MKGKAPVKKVSDKSKKKDKAKEIKRTSLLPGEAAVKKKVVKRVKPGGVKAKKKTKAKIKVQVKADKKSAKTLTGGKEKENPQKPVKKSATEKKKQAGKTDKKASPKGSGKIALNPTVRRGKIRKVAKKTKQVKQAAGQEKKIGRKLTSQKKRTRAAKILHSARIKTEIKPDIKVAPEPLIKEKLKREEKTRKEVKAGRIPETHGRKGKEADEIKGSEKMHPLSEEKYSPAQWKIFPEEYGENDIKLMTVDPYRLFAFWEVMEDIPEIYRGDINIRIHDVTGAGFEGLGAEDSYFDIKADERIGKSYIRVRPAGEFVADIGIIHDGIFISLARSMKVSTPRAGISEQGAWPQEIYETGPPRMGY